MHHLVQKCCPILPSLFLEGRLGYDVKMRMPGSIFFFQFKIPNALIYNSAYEKRHFKIGSHNPFCGLKPPFLRMPITKGNISKQHKMLIDLQYRKRNTSAKIFYATPLFIDPRELGKKYRKSSVHYSSGFISPEEIGNLLLSDRHFVSYNMEENHKMYGWVCADNAFSMTRWPLNPQNFHFGPMKCVRIYEYVELEQMAADSHNDGITLDESIEEVSKCLEEVIDVSEYREESYTDSTGATYGKEPVEEFYAPRKVMDAPKYIGKVYEDFKEDIEDFREIIDGLEYHEGGEEYRNACRYFDSEEHKNEVRLKKMKGHEGKSPTDWLSDIEPSSRESFESLYTLQHLARSYFGCETAIFQPE